MPNFEKKRAAYAWTKVQGCSKEYESLAKSAPVLIMNNGLMQTLAFFASRGKPHYKSFIEHIFDWLEREERFRLDKRGNANTGKFNVLMDFLNNADSITYRQVTEEVLGLLKWIRQFSAAVEGSKPREEDKQ